MSAVLETIDVTVRAGSKTILEGASLALAAGERLAIVGPNGAGKTTLLRSIAGNQRLHRGIIRLKGRALASYPAGELARHRAVLSQHVAVAFPFTVREIVAMGAGHGRGRWLDRMIDDTLAEVDLAGLGERVITTLSGGEQQRAHLARVLVQLAHGEIAHGPGLLLLDEPTASLDLNHQLRLLSVTARAAERGVAVIAILHDLNLAAVFADRILVMNRGCITAAGAPRDTITEPMLNDVFGVAGGVGTIPHSNTPFVLPHHMTVR
jgi:iron complex transport system ATP-binding protein